MALPLVTKHGIDVLFLRSDLTTALVTGAKPVFFSEGISTEPFIAKATDKSYTMWFSDATLDPRLAAVGTDLGKFCDMANLAFHTGHRIPFELFQEILISVQYRLMVVDFPRGWPNEPIRVGLLAFATSLFLQTEGIKVRFEFLSSQLKDLFSKTEWPIGQPFASYRLWLLFIAAITAATVDDDGWLKPLLVAACQSSEGRNKTWSDIRTDLKSVLWVNNMHDQAGEAVFRRLVYPEL